MSKTFGFELLARQTSDAVLEQVNRESVWWQANPHTGDSPIEKLLYLALYCQTRFGNNLQNWDLKIASVNTLDSVKAMDGFQEFLILQRQVDLPTVGRVDFLIHAYGLWALEPDGGLEGWRTLVVECDGHEFHERTKEQAAKDRSRDRAAALAGYEVFRFTGSELWCDPWGCAGQIMKWAERGI